MKQYAKGPAAIVALALLASRRVLARSGRLSAALAGALVLILALAPAAGADRGIVAQYKFPDPNTFGIVSPPGQFKEATGGDINASGEGGAAAGDLYLIDNGAGGFLNATTRVQQFSAAGNFKRLWGSDVVSTGPGNADETQTVRVLASAGTFKLTFGGETTPPIPFDAAASTVQAALNSLASIGGVGGAVTVAGGPGSPTGLDPYVITFGGTQANADQPSLGADSSQLTGGNGAVAWIATTNNGGTGNEICDPSAGDTCKEAVFNGTNLTFGRGLAIDQASGDIYFLGSSSISRYSATGEFLRRMGWDVVKEGPHDTGVNEVQQVTVQAEGGTFTLSMFIGGSQTTAPIPFDASAQEVEEAINATPGFSAQAVNGPSPVSVTGGPGDASGSTPYQLEFTGRLGSDEVGEFSASASDLIGGGKAVAVTTIVQGGGPEVCVGPVDICKEGERNSEAGSVSGYATGIAVVPAGLPNSGNIVVGDGLCCTAHAGKRVSEFTKAGEFVRTFGWDVDADDPSTGFEICTAASGHRCKSGTSGSNVGQFNSQAESIAVDSTGAIYTVEPTINRRVQKFTPQAGDPELVPSLFGAPGAPNGTSDSDAPIAIETGPNDEIFVAKRYPAGSTTCASGASSPTEFRILELTSDGSTLVETSTPCTTDTALQFERANVASVPMDGIIVDRATGAPALVDQPFGSTRVFVYGEPGQSPDLALDSPSNVGASGATITGTIDPNGPGAVPYPNPTTTRYRVEYRKVGDPGWQLWSADVGIGSGTTALPFSVGISGLAPKTEYEARVTVTKPYGFPLVQQITSKFTTLAAAPTVDSFTSSNVTPGSATLSAVVNPRGAATTVRFEYGTTTALGQVTPDIQIGEDALPVALEAQVEGLSPVVYHFRVVAENELGTTISERQTFSFYPEPCPNSVARQQTGSGSLPDCRAYELVSPANAGSATLLSGGPNSGLAQSPSRFSFFGGLGAIPGPWNPPSFFGDLYVATRTESGWRTNYVGLPADEAFAVGEAPGQTATLLTDDAMDRFLVWDLGEGGFADAKLLGSLVAHVIGADGKRRGRLPTNASEVPGAMDDLSKGGLRGDLMTSSDLVHYFFSSANHAFVPGGLTSGQGSAYDNNTITNEISLISRRNDGSHIPPEAGNQSDSYLLIPGASADGSKVLLAATGTGLCGAATCPSPPCFGCGRDIASHLYMRADNAITYDVSRGHLVNYIGMTRDASEVFFTSAEQITGDDEDTSIDLYRWREDDDSVTRVSAGSGTVGNTDACNASWIASCGIEVVPFNNGTPSQPATDNAIAARAGDVYFYSPEQFVGAEGIPGRPNLYVARESGVEYVTTLESTKRLSRIQVSPDGDFAAFITASQLTTADTGGVAAMYRYAADQDDLRCVSCNPTGLVPTHDVRGSQNGLFMTDDGRVFFSTADPLVPADSNGVTDVYEYVDGRAQLISSGIAASDQVPAGEIGLVGVSANGVDVFFSTVERLLAADQNGSSLKFYNARTSGGFPVSAAIAPCEAADECHGADASPVVAPRVASVASLGDFGNVREAGRRCADRAKRARKLSRRAKANRQRAKRAGRALGLSDPSVRARFRSAARFASQAKKTRKKAQKCRSERRVKP